MLIYAADVKPLSCQFFFFLNYFALIMVVIHILFVLSLNVPVNNFSVMSRWSQRFLGLTSTVGS